MKNRSLNRLETGFTVMAIPASSVFAFDFLSYVCTSAKRTFCAVFESNVLEKLNARFMVWKRFHYLNSVHDLLSLRFICVC